MMMYNFAVDYDRPNHARTTVAANIESVIAQHNALVRRIAWHVHSRMSGAIEMEDLIQIGLIALVEAARSYEDRGLSFAPYAAMRVRGAMIDALRREARMSRAGMVNRRTLAATRARLQTEFGRAVSDYEMAVSLNLSAGAYHQMVASTQAMQQEAIDESYSDHDMWFADAADSADTVMEKIQLSDTLAQNITQLPPREAMVLQLYFAEEMNLEEIGMTLGIGAARVCQIKKRALGTLKAAMAQGSDDALI
jgi:RNA polymerase sigma factor FliA